MSKTHRAEILLFLAALVWGYSFVAQRIGAQYLGALTFNGLRFALGATVLYPWARRYPLQTRAFWGAALPAGGILFGAAFLQQYGVTFTTAGNAGFITGLYVALTPILGRFLGMRTSRRAWAAVALAVLGLYFLSVRADLTFAIGDVWVLASAFLWAAHVLYLSHKTQQVAPVALAFGQFAVCAVLSLLFGVFFEPIRAGAVWQAGAAIAYGGLISVGVGYTLQAIGQKDAPPTRAALILSLESPLALLSGAVALAELVTLRQLWGCGLMLAGTFLAVSEDTQQNT
ncbi:MAG: DMT family transporter [Anaerolineales bacterium]